MNLKLARITLKRPKTPRKRRKERIDEVSRSSLNSFHIFQTVVYDRYISQTNSYICQKKLLRNVTASK